MVMVHPSNSQKEKQVLINSQLKQQSSMKRIPVSDAIASLLVGFILLFQFYVQYLLTIKDFVAKNEKDDHLLQGSMVKNKQGDKSEGNNPFRVRPSNNKCTIA